MSVTVFVPALLQEHTSGARTVEVTPVPATVENLLETLFALHPGLRDRVLTETGRVRQHVNLFLGATNIRDRCGLHTPVEEGEELTILAAVSGG